MVAHEHDHGRSFSTSGKLGFAFLLNFLFTIIEFTGGLWTNSLAILSDAIHDLGDSLALAMAWYLEKFSKRDADRRFTYGYRRFSVLGAIINSTILIVGTVLIIREAIPRIIHPEAANATGMIWMAVLGILFNGIGALMVNDKHSLNNRVVSLHLFEDVLGWIVVLIGAITMKYTGWLWLDSAMSLGISIFIGYRAIGNLRSGLRIVMQGSPDDDQVAKVKKAILTVKKVNDVHDLRIWSLDGSRSILSAHIVVAAGLDYSQMAAIKSEVHDLLKGLGMAHCTLELEVPGECESRLAATNNPGD